MLLAFIIMANNTPCLGFKCNFCGKYVNTAQGLKSHVTRLHKDHQNKCSSPNQTFVKVLAADFVPTAGTEPLDEFDSLEFAKELANYKKNFKILRRIPKGARGVAAEALSEVIFTILNENTVSSWVSLLRFPMNCFKSNKQEPDVSLATQVKKNIAIYRSKDMGRSFLDDQIQNISSPPQISRKVFSPKLVEAKMSEGDVRGAIRSLCSEDFFAPNTQATLDALLLKHPPEINPTVDISDSSSADVPFLVSDEMVKDAVNSFPLGSAGGPDGLRPQHLKDLTGHSAGAQGIRLIDALQKLSILMFKGQVPHEICPILYGATLHAFKKKNDDIRPIAVGNTLRRLVAKIGSASVKTRLGEIFAPIQLGYGCKGGAEAAVHAARRFLAFPHQGDTIFLKIDFRNAFNSLYRDKMLHAVQDLMPELFPFLNQCYNQASHLMFNEHHISSQRGIQQGDPLGPAIFCSTIHPLASKMTADLNIWFLDDGALGGRSQLVYEDLKRISLEAKDLGLDLNLQKCEAFNLQTSRPESSEPGSAFPDLVNSIMFPELSDCVLLGAPLTEEGIPKVFSSKTEELNLLRTRLSKISSHISFYILKNALAIPKLSYILRSAPIWRWNTGLKDFDCVLRTSLESICNASLSEEAWTQSALPIANGGLGIRHAENLALPAFLASVSSTHSLTNKILPPCFLREGDGDLSGAIAAWSELSNTSSIMIENKKLQNCWEKS